MTSNISNRENYFPILSLPEDAIKYHILPNLPCEVLLGRMPYVRKLFNLLMDNDMWRIVAANKFPGIKNDENLPWKKTIKQHLSLDFVQF